MEGQSGEVSKKQDMNVKVAALSCALSESAAVKCSHTVMTAANIALPGCFSIKSRSEVLLCYLLSPVPKRLMFND